MEKNTVNSDTEDVLSLSELIDKANSRPLSSEEENVLKRLIPDVDSSYFKDKSDIWNKSSERGIIEMYNNAKIKPHVRIVDFNSQGSDGSEDNKLQPGAEIGIEVKL